MSATLANSKLLDSMLQRAEALKNERGHKNVNSNHFLAAVLQYWLELRNNPKKEDFFREYSVAELDEIQNLLFVVGRLSFDNTKVEKLLSGKEFFINDLMFKESLSKAESMAKEKGYAVITVDLLVECIFEMPTEEIKSIIRSSDKEKQMSSDDFEVIKKEASGTENNPETELSYDSDVDQKEKIAKLIESAKTIHKKLSEVVFGQENAIEVFVEGYFRSELEKITNKNKKRPATFLFAGPPGVGKTFLAEQAASLLGKLPYKRFDMSEYADKEAITSLCGSNQVYKDSKEGTLTDFVKKNPKCILLFDEIEKANIRVIHLFLQVLDAGRLGDIHQEESIDFSQAIIIFTTNAGRKIYEDAPRDSDLSRIPRKTILKALEKDVDPKTGEGVFPAAICSRFATGNVVMFNHMKAHDLRKIVVEEILENAESFKKQVKIDINVSNDVFSCILFAEGGNVDARTIKSRAASFFSNELYELFRLITIEDNGYDLNELDEIRIVLDFPEDDEQVMRLFKNENKASILVLAPENVSDKIRPLLKDYNVVTTSGCDEAIEKVNEFDFDIVLCDLNTGTFDQEDSLNIQDVDSEGTDLFDYICEKTNIPFYFIYDKDNDEYAYEEVVSLLKDGARSGIDISSEDGFVKEIDNVMVQIHHQASMNYLAKSNKLVTYQTSQTISEDHKIATIEMYDISLETAVDADDSNFVVNVLAKPDIRFSDVIGAENAKEELRYFIDVLKNPKEYTNRNISRPKGILLYGPPGTGKTMLAKAVAGESDFTFISTSGSEFLQSYVGQSEEKVRRIFRIARRYAPTIIFIDEFDTIATERKGSDTGHGALSESVLTTFLAEMDGFATDYKNPVFVIAATNYDVKPGTPKSIDQAIVRRFNNSIYVDLPNKEERMEFIRKKINESELFVLSEETIDNIALRSTGMSLAKIDSVFGHALRLATRDRKTLVDDALFEEAFDSFNYGEEKKWDPSDVRKTAYHEAGHAFAYWWSGNTPTFVTIVSRGEHGGYMMPSDDEAKMLYTKKDLLTLVRTSLGGRASELVFFGDEDGLTTGASSDLANATHIAKKIVCGYGMDDEVGLAVIADNEVVDSVFAQKIRNSVNKILSKELQEARRIISENRTAIEELVDVLMKKNYLNADEIEEVFSRYSNRPQIDN